MATTRRHTPRTYTLEEKIALVTEIEQRYRAGGISLKAAAYELAEREPLMAEVDRLRGEGRGVLAACREVLREVVPQVA